MKAWKLAIVLSFVTVTAFAQEQMAVRINEKGIMKVLKMALQYNTATKESRTVVIPQNIYKFTLPKAQLLSNPIIPVLNEISDINMKRDLDFRETYRLLTGFSGLKLDNGYNKNSYAL